MYASSNKNENSKLCRFLGKLREVLDTIKSKLKGGSKNMGRLIIKVAIFF